MSFIKVRLDRNLCQLQRRMEKIMDEMMSLRGPFLSTADTEWSPEVDIYETNTHLFVVIGLAGVNREDIDVTFCSPFLRVRGNRGSLNGAGELLKYHQLEMGRGEFERIFRLPAAVEQEEMEALYEDGLLTIRMKKGNRSHPVSVEIK